MSAVRQRNPVETEDGRRKIHRFVQKIAIQVRKRNFEILPE